MYDAHIHIALDGADWRQATKLHANGADERSIRETLEKYASAGFTYLRDGGDKWGASTLAASLAHEYGITYATPAFAIHRKGAYGSFLGNSFANMQEYRKLVDEAARQGATFIKLMLTGILDFSSYGTVTNPDIDAFLVQDMVAYAHKLGFSVMAHTNGADAITTTLDAGVDSIEHGFYLDSTACYAMAQGGVVWIPTFAPLMSQAVIRADFAQVINGIVLQHQTMAEKAASAGVPIALGTDAGSSGVEHACWINREREALGTSAAMARALEEGESQIRCLFPGA